jgi:hypothetical protein
VSDLGARLQYSDRASGPGSTWIPSERAHGFRLAIMSRDTSRGRSCTPKPSSWALSRAQEAPVLRNNTARAASVTPSACIIARVKSSGGHRSVELSSRALLVAVACRIHSKWTMRPQAVVVPVRCLHTMISVTPGNLFAETLSCPHYMPMTCPAAIRYVGSGIGP